MEKIKENDFRDIAAQNVEQFMIKKNKSGMFFMFFESFLHLNVFQVKMLINYRALSSILKTMLSYLKIQHSYITVLHKI